RRATGPLPGRTGTTGQLSPAQGARMKTGPLSRGYGTAPLTAPPALPSTQLTTAPLTPLAGSNPASLPPAASAEAGPAQASPRALPPVAAAPPLDLNALNEELDDVL